MCVICYIPKGVETPSKTMLTAMYKANPHGIGFCTPKTLYKGMNFDLFYKRIQQRRIEEPCLLHFRLATHGSVKRANCHPFYDKCTDTYFMHNGILNIRPMGDMTDSETAYRSILVPYIKEIWHWFKRDKRSHKPNYRRFKICFYARLPCDAIR